MRSREDVGWRTFNKSQLRYTQIVPNNNVPQSVINIVRTNVVPGTLVQPEYLGYYPNFSSIT